MKVKVGIIILIAVFNFNLRSQTGPWQLTSYPTFAGGWALSSIGNTVFAGGGNGIYTSSDYGQTWTNTFSLSTLSLISYSNNTLFAGGSSAANGAIWTSTNAGLTWVNITPSIFPFNNGWNLHALLINGSFLYASATNGGSIYRCPLSNLNPSSWTTYNSGLPISPDITDLEFNGTNILASTFNQGVWATSPSIASWSNTSSGITNTNFMRDIAVDNQTVLIGTAGAAQMHRSTNYGINWNPVSTSAFSTNCEVWSITTRSNNIYAGTDQNGVMYSNDYGTSWIGYNLGFKDASGNWICSNMRVYSLLFMADTLFAGTNCGIWKSWGCSYPLNSTSVSNLTVCSNHTTQLNANDLGTLNWYTSPTSSVSIATGSTFITPLLTVNVTYYVGNDFCSTRDTIDVVVKPSPTLNVISSSSILCSGESASISATGASSYTWNTSATGTIILVTPSVTTTYTVIGTAPNGCTVQQTYSQNVSACLGSKELVRNVQIKVYPNPSKSILNFRIDTPGNHKMYILDQLGKVVLNTENRESINISSLSNGIYFIRLSIENGPDLYSKFIKE